MLVDKFHECLKIQSEASYSITDGFEVQKYVEANGEMGLVEGKIVNNVPSINNKLLTKSIKVIRDYDNQKDHEYYKNYGHEWSLHKRNIDPGNQHQL